MEEKEMGRRETNIDEIEEDRSRRVEERPRRREDNGERRKS